MGWFSSYLLPELVFVMHSSSKQFSEKPQCTSGWVTVYDFRQSLVKVPIGRPVANTAAYVLGEDMRPVQGGEVGQLYIASHNLALGYAGDQGFQMTRAC